VAITSQAHSDTSTAAAISPPAALCMPLNTLLFLITGFTRYLIFKQAFYIKAKNTKKIKHLPVIYNTP
jgi:hypothetical protein